MADIVKTPWILGKLSITHDVLAQLEKEAVAAYLRQEEACGYLRGPIGQPTHVDNAVIMENLANRYHELDPETYPRKANEYFLLNSNAFQRAIDAGASDGNPVKVLWHSHLDVGAYFSETDAAAATMGGSEPAHSLAYLVTSVQKGVVDDHRLFIWNENAFVESPFTRVSGSEGSL